MSNDIRLVCFDLGRVLVPLCDNWQHARQVANVPIALPQLDDARRSTLFQYVHASECGHLTQDQFCHHAGSVFGIDPKHVVAMSNVYLMGVFDGAAELLDELERADRQIACLSNTNDSHWQIIFGGADPAYDPLQRIRHRYGSHLIGLRKPDPAIYEHVERDQNLRPNQIVFFDDLIENIDGARKRGWHAFHILKDQGGPIEQARRHLVQLGVLADEGNS